MQGIFSCPYLFMVLPGPGRRENGAEEQAGGVAGGRNRVAEGSARLPSVAGAPRKGSACLSAWRGGRNRVLGHGW